MGNFCSRDSSKIALTRDSLERNRYYTERFGPPNLVDPNDVLLHLPTLKPIGED